MARRLPCLLLVLCTALLGGCDWLGPATSLDLSFSDLKRDTLRERQHSLFLVRQAWDFRPEETNDTEYQAERRFINRFGTFARKLRGTESANDGASLWGRVIQEHLRRFPDAVE